MIEEDGVGLVALRQGDPQDRRAHHRQCGLQAALQGHRGNLNRQQLDWGGQAVLRRPHQLPDQLGGLQQGPRRLLLVKYTHVDIISRWQSRHIYVMTFLQDPRHIPCPE